MLSSFIDWVFYIFDDAVKELIQSIFCSRNIWISQRPNANEFCRKSEEKKNRARDSICIVILWSLLFIRGENKSLKLRWILNRRVSLQVYDLFNRIYIGFKIKRRMNGTLPIQACLLDIQLTMTERFSQRILEVPRKCSIWIREHILFPLKRNPIKYPLLSTLPIQ